MKTVIILLTAIALAALIGMWYFYNKSKRPTPDNHFCTTQCYEANSTNEFNPLNGKLAKTLVQNYHGKQWLSYQTAAGGFADTRAVWFSLATLKRFIHEIEAKTCNSCMEEKPELGVRIYFGTYPNAAQWSYFGLDQTAVGDSFADHHTVMMVPTYFDADQKLDIDFDPGHIDEGTCKPMTMEDVFDTSAGPIVVDFLTPAHSRSAGMQNHGNGWPPPSLVITEPGGELRMVCNGATFAGVTDGIRCH